MHIWLSPVRTTSVTYPTCPSTKSSNYLYKRIRWWSWRRGERLNHQNFPWSFLWIDVMALLPYKHFALVAFLLFSIILFTMGGNKLSLQFFLSDVNFLSLMNLLFYKSKANIQLISSVLTRGFCLTSSHCSSVYQARQGIRTSWCSS